MTAAGDASNQRTADHLRTIHGVGDMPRWTADALETAGDKGVADVADLLEKVHQNNPAQARQLADETFERLSPETKKRLRGMEAEAARPAAGDNDHPFDIIDEAGASHVDTAAGKATGTAQAPSKSKGENRSKADLLAKTKWSKRPEPRQHGSRQVHRTKGPIKVGHRSPTPGVDGVRYHVKWWPLDKNGKRKAVFEKTGNQGEEISSVSGFNIENPEPFEPPWNNPEGWEVEVWTPPQESTHGNSSGHTLDVYLSDQVNKRKGR